MAAVALFVIFFFFAIRRRSRSTASFPEPFLAWAWIYVRVIFLVIAFVGIGTRDAALPVTAIAVILAPSLILRWIIVPLGWPRVAYWTVRSGLPLESVRQSKACAVMYAALAQARKRRPAPGRVDWLDERLKKLPAPRGIGVVAAGLLAGLRGDRNRARQLLAIADTLSARHISRGARTVARDWLVADAARIGNWRDVTRLGRRGWRSLRGSYALARIGERLVRDPGACPDWLLRLIWLAAPRRLATLPLLRRAIAIPRDRYRATPVPPAATDLPAALANLAEALNNRVSVDGPSLVRAAGEVDVQLDCPGTGGLVQRRLLALGGHDPEAVVPSVRKRLSDMLAMAIEDRPSLAEGNDRGPLIDRAIEQVRARWFRDIEAQCKDYGDRKSRGSALTALAEWEAWAELRDTADRLLELDPASESSLFQVMYAPACNFAVFQQNTFRRVSFAHAIYVWLRTHAGGDVAAAQLLMRNIRASRG